ncbi:hypothetical protein OG875_05235 [Streptomyces sp. NBC_01498]|uniref:DNA polymerase III subunit beta family protein n=1 Tax=Streptomyces sp. NBC_01498 TaxID=2975870 RepID=UPI002E7BFB6E|nr:hypothetical protein [Streptomyces sp. NBC_01498]WTL24062.1 hypothetical protein OG875_05235 [Streptomyces sp. NBC_01498]
MSVTINAHRLGQLIDKVRGHVGSESIEILNGIRLDADSSHLYAVATDRFTLAAARYRLKYDDAKQEPWARTIPTSWLKPLREWVSAHGGGDTIRIALAEGFVVFGTEYTEIRIPVTDDQEFADWRRLLRGASVQPGTIFAFPAVSSRLLARWADTGQALRVHVTTDLKAFMLFGEDFIGVQMPERYAGIGPVEEETFEQALELWPGIFADADDTADMATDMPAEVDEMGTIPEMVRSLLQQTLRSTGDMLGAPSRDPGAMASFALAGVNAWSAYRFLDALHTADPRLAEKVVAELGEELDAGDFSEHAWDIAAKAGHDPQAWHDDYAAHLKKLAEKRAAEQPAT